MKHHRHILIQAPNIARLSSLTGIADDIMDTMSLSSYMDEEEDEDTCSLSPTSSLAPSTSDGSVMYMYITFTLSYIAAVNQVETLALPCFVLICVGDLNSASRAASVAQLVELQPRTLKVVGLSPTRGSNFSLKGCCLGI